MTLTFSLNFACCVCQLSLLVSLSESIFYSFSLLGGVILRRKKAYYLNSVSEFYHSNMPESKDLVQCYNRGCGQLFNPNKNDKGACVFQKFL